MALGVGQILLNRKRAIRAPDNPMDKSTVISIYPKSILEIKHTIQPGRFEIASGSFENPAILVVGSSSWWRDVDEEAPLLEIPVGSVLVADAVVRDYCNSVLASNMDDRMPGLFFLQGKWNIQQIKTEHKEMLEKALVKQRNWYTSLIELADALWATSNGNPLTISDDMRLAAKEMNATGKDWMQQFTMVANVNCPACGVPKKPDYPVCPNCKAITDVDKAKALNLKFAV